ncbi:hypothetical protein S40288_07466 [Stachybotrys chartarum IBT 40288]|nr:hypothetical protein S40288_07466 [Stachybotrys chartarum IBT 40288]
MNAQRPSQGAADASTAPGANLPPYSVVEGESSNPPANPPAYPFGRNLLGYDAEEEEATESEDPEKIWLGKTNDDFVPVPLSPQWIDLTTLRGWINMCISEHGAKCWPLQQLDGLPAWLVDVRQQCLVAATPEHSYFALSYVWGNVEAAELIQENLIDFLQPGAFDVANRDVVIPKTVRHAMELVALLDETYLWVDRLCICQDDADTKDEHINIMSHIYNNSLVTLIAASGWDANHGLRGIKGVTEPRNLSPNAGDDYFKSIEPQSSIWYSRGWTFQELFFSQRRLMFNYNVAIWECGCSLRHEIHGTQWVNELPVKMRINPGQFDRILRRGEDSFMDEANLRLYISIVNKFNARNLTFPEDAARAFAGVINAFTKAAFPGGFLWGLPADCFEASLCWVSSEPMTRRVPRLPGSEELPTWSWMGWQGQLRNDLWMDLESQKDYERDWRMSLEGLTPVCQWLYVEKEDPEHPIPIASGISPRSPLRYLITATEITTFWVHDRPNHLNDMTEGLQVPARMLANEAEEFAGMLLGQSEELNRLPHGMKVECLAVSTSPNSLMGGSYWTGSVWGTPNYYNVLWVAREDDVMMRRGVGRIMTSMWLSNQDKEFEVVKLA